MEVAEGLGLWSGKVLEDVTGGRVPRLCLDLACNRLEARSLIHVKEVGFSGPQGPWRDFNVVLPCTPAAHRCVSFCVVSMCLIMDSGG